ncbi:Bug family tripartite tricarboxylate transporter substrate binding protein [Falsiroseomonas sp.]|uniref:Bug family tripartite tricarboxylate transporter substrate binding protein n=1 Tax=Falsiroseomonas sp. TaxID=2870721 RepID=UPI003F711DAC
MQQDRISAARPHPGRRMIAGAALVAAAALALPAAPALAQYPDRPVTVIVPFPAGGGTDAVARVMAERMAQRLGQPVVIENRGGANGIVGTQAAARARADGHVLLFSTSSSISANPSLRRSLPYDPVRDFVPIARLGRFPFMLVVNPSLPARTVQDFVALGRSRTVPLTYGSWTTTGIVAGESLRRLAPVEITNVPYRGTGDAVSDLLGGRIDALFIDLTSGLPHVRSGAMRALGGTAATRTEALPELPTIAESGVAGYDVSSWAGYFAPAGTPDAVVQSLAATIMEILQDSAMRSRLLQLGFDVTPLSGPAFEAYVAAELDTWRALIRLAGIEPE